MFIGKLDEKEYHSAGQPRRWQVFPGIAMMRSNSPQPALFADLLIRFNFSAATAQGFLTMYDSMWQKNIFWGGPFDAISDKSEGPAACDKSTKLI